MAAMMNILKNEGPDYYLVWTLLLSDARREPGKVKTAAGTVEMQRGDVLISYRGLADRLGYGERRKDAVRRIVKKMCATDALQMRHQVRHHFSVVSITDYDAWALTDDGVAPPFARPMRDRCDSSRKSLIEAEEASNSKDQPKEPPFRAEEVFAAIWAEYPRKIGRSGALRHFKATVKTPEDALRVTDALRRFNDELRANRTLPRFTPHGSTWFSRWQEHAEMYETHPPPMLLVKKPAASSHDWENDPRLHQWDDDERETPDA